MAKHDPKLLKKVNQSELIQAAELMGIKNAVKVSKENLISAFTKKVEDVPEGEKAELDEVVVKTYNNILTIFGEAEGGQEPPENKEKSEEAQGKSEEVVKESGKEEGGEKKMKKNNGKKEKAPKKAAKKTEKKEAKERYSRFDAILDSIKEMKRNGDVEALVDLTNKRYMANGGSDQRARLQFYCKGVLKVMEGLGIISISEGKFKTVK